MLPYPPLTLSHLVISSLFFLKQWGDRFFFFVFLSSFCTGYDLCRLNMINWFSLFYCDTFLCMGDSNCKADSIRYNWIHMYYSHHIIIKYVGFKPIYRIIY